MFDEEEQILIETGTPENSRGPLYIRVVLPIVVEPKIVWQVLTDYEHLPEFVPHMVTCRVLEREGNKVIMKQVFRHLFISMGMLLSVKEDAPRKISFKRLRGNLKAYDGCWCLKPLNPEGTLLTLEMAFQPGFPVPRALVSWALKRELPKGLLILKKRAMWAAGKVMTSEGEG